MTIFSYVKEQVAILDVIQSYTTLKKTGLYWKGHCPFHVEKTASFTVSPHKGIFYCFGCHVHGDVISFIAKIENCSTREAVQFLVDRYQLTVPESINQHISSQKNNRYYEICEHIARWCHKQLLEHPSVQLYLKKRMITQKSIDSFLLGYFPGSSTLKYFLHDMKAQSVLVDDLVSIHFLSQSTSQLYSSFENRIIFPIKDHLGRFCGFGGRIFKAADTRVKYYNSSETEHFNKGKLLFGLDLAKKSIQQSGTAFLVEGYTDCIAMVEHGHTNTVATLGTACTVSHLEQLSRYAQELMVIYDADTAGQHALIRLVELCWQATLDLKVIQLPTGEDPASFLQSNNLKPLVERAQDIFDYFIATTSKGFYTKPLTEKLQIARRIIEVIYKLEDPLKRNILLNMASHKLDIPLESIRGKKKRRQQLDSSHHLKKSSHRAKNNDESTQKLSKKIFFAIIQNISLLQAHHTDYLCTFLPEPVRSLLRTLKEMQDKKAEPVSFTEYFDTLDENDQNRVSKLILEIEDEPSPEEFEKLIGKLQKAQWKMAVQNVKSKIEQAKKDQNQQEIGALLEELMLLKKKIVGKDLI